MGGTSYANYLGCPIKNAQVCLEDHKLTSDQEVQSICTMTDSEGNYVLPAVLGTRVSPKVNYNEHEFQPTVSNDYGNLYSTGIKIESDTVYEGHNFEDITKANITIEVAGGLCNRVLGYSTIHMSIPGCQWEGNEYYLN